MEEQNIITREGLKELKEELKHLVGVERPKVIEEIKEARDQGDLSENAEFDAAREKQGQIEDRITEIERIIEESKVITATGKSSNQVRIGSTVKVKVGAAENEFTIVGALEADPMEGKISNVSPLGAALLNKSKGDEITYSVNINNKTKKNKVKVISIANK